MRWRNRHIELGEAGLRVRKASGRPPRLTLPQKQGLLLMLLWGPEAYGWKTQVWTTKRIAQLIRQRYGISYHPDHIGRVLHQLGWTVQKPERRAVERNEAAIQRWTDTAWERVKNFTRLGAHLIFIDESGFMLAPTVHRTWSPVGQTPLLRHRHRNDRLSFVSGLSVSPQRYHLGLYGMFFLDNIGQEEICLFIREVLRHLRGRVIALLDNSNTHRGAMIKKLCLQFARLTLVYFPSHAPELNPDEGVWG